jgi:hypothetical protein
MARPSAALIEELQPTNDISDMLLAVRAVYALTYQGHLISMRRESITMRGRSIKYPKTQWPHEGTAKNRVKKLNELHGTTDFGYICLYKATDDAKPAAKKPAPKYTQSYEAN